MNRLWLLGAVSLVVILLAVGIGSVFISPAMVIHILLGGQNATPMQISILQNIRLPRVLMAYVCGAGLSLSGVVMQSVLKNPLASSYTIGTSTGAAVGASIAIVFGLHFFGAFTIPIFGFLFAILTVVAGISISAKFSALENTTLILVGMAISFFGGAILTLLVTIYSNEMQRLIFWQMGNVSGIPLHTVFLLAIFIVICLSLTYLKHKELDIITMDDLTAASFGVDIKKVKWLMLILSAVLTGAIVSFVGIIGFVDLFTPPVARRLVGNKHRHVLLASALLGGSFMVLCDLIARTALSPIELPIGAITALFGGPLFIYLYLRGIAHAHR